MTAQNDEVETARKTRVCCASCKHWHRLNPTANHLGRCMLMLPPALERLIGSLEPDANFSRFDDRCDFHA
jgi:hypothetical protein